MNHIIRNLSNSSSYRQQQQHIEKEVSVGKFKTR